MTTGDWILVGGAALGAWLVFGRAPSRAARPSSSSSPGLGVPTSQEEAVGVAIELARDKAGDFWTALGGGKSASPEELDRYEGARYIARIAGPRRVRDHTVIDVARGDGVQTYTNNGITHTSSVRVVG